jgi:hypothetical protein
LYLFQQCPNYFQKKVDVGYVDSQLDAQTLITAENAQDMESEIVSSTKPAALLLPVTSTINERA